MMHSQPAETMTHDQWFPISVEMQLLGGDGVEERPNGNIYTPGTQVVVDGVLREEDLIQAETHTTDFRKIKLLPLKGCMDPDARNYKSYYVLPDPEACEY